LKFIIKKKLSGARCGDAEFWCESVWYGTGLQMVRNRQAGAGAHH